MLGRQPEIAADPVEQFAGWYREVQKPFNHVGPADAVCLATVDASGQPSARMVLLKSYDAQGFVFYTNFESRKAIALDEQPAAALLFHWPALGQQVRIEGRVARVSDAEADAYFASRPRGHQLSAWASPQSREIADRESLEARMVALEREYAGRAVPRPPHWGGYRLVPQRFEFWLHRDDRLHDRWIYLRADGGGWDRRLLAP